MPEFLINVAQIEELQMINDKDELEKIFNRAKSMVIQGGTMVLARKLKDGKMERFDEITTEADLAAYKKGVFKYL